MPLAITPTQAEQNENESLFPAEGLIAFALVTGLFFLWGVANNLNDVLIRQFMKSFELSRLQAGLVQFAFYIGYFVFSIPAAIVMRRRGYKFGLLTGLLLYGAGTFIFWPAAAIGSYALFLLGLFVIASGLGFLETGANPLIAQMGGAGSAVRRLNFSQAFNPLGSISGVLIGTMFIFSGIELKPEQIAQLKAAGAYQAYLHNETMRVVGPYLAIGALVLLWALLIALTRFPAVATAQAANNDEAPNDQAQGSFGALARYPHFLFAVAAQFCYVGAQVGTWSYFIQYVQDYTHSPEKTAGYLLTGTLLAFGIGRFFSAALMEKVSPSRLMGLYSIINILLLTAGVLQPGWTGLWAIFLSSFFMSVMYPTIFALGIEGLNVNTKIGASLIIMAIIGGAVLTPLMGLISQKAGNIAVAYTVPLGAYVFVALYAFWGAHLRPFALRNQKR